MGGTAYSHLIDRGRGGWDPELHARVIALLHPEISVPVRHMPVLIAGGVLCWGVVCSR